MKTNLTRLNRLCAALMAGTALLGATSAGWAQGTTPTSDYTNDFDTVGSTASWIYWYGIHNNTANSNYFNNTAMVWDPTMDAKSNVNSGSLFVSIPFGIFGTNGNAGDQAVWFGTFDNNYGYDGNVVYDGTKFTNITFDVYVSPTNIPSASGDFGSIQVGLVQQGWLNGGTFYGNSPVIPGSASNGWVHLSQTIDQTSGGLDAVAGIDFKYTSYSGYPTNPISFWIDNIDVHLRATNVVIPPPTLSAPYKPNAGLNLLSTSANGGNNQRTDIGLINSGVGNTWLGATSSVTYSITITNFPNPAIANYGAYQAQIFLTSGAFPRPTTEQAPDYGESNVVFLEVDETPTGGAYASFRYKINLPNSENMYGADNGISGTLVTMNASTVRGTWSMTFNNNTNVTLSGPGGVSTNFVFTNAASVSGGVTNFADPLNIFFGAQPNNLTLIGQEVTLAAVSVTGNGNPVSDNFLTDTPPLNPAWGIYAGDINAVQLLRPDPADWWVNWSLPDSGFGLQTTANLSNRNSWTALTGPDAVTFAPLFTYSGTGARFAYVPGTDLGSGTASFFRLDQQKFTKLQVLLPGESNAPGTPTGKTGSPTPISFSTGQPFNITVNACDANWTIITSVNDTVHFTSTDGSASLPPDSPLFGGTATLSMSFSAQGSWTVTASDVTQPAIQSGTSSPAVMTP